MMDNHRTTTLNTRPSESSSTHNPGDGDAKAVDELDMAIPVNNGKWTVEEVEYMLKLIEAFNAGVLGGLLEGTRLRSFLAQRLSCKPKRISKRLEGVSHRGIGYNGRQTYRKRPQPDEELTRHYHEALSRLEWRYLQSDTRGGGRGRNSKTMSTPTTSLGVNDTAKSMDIAASVTASKTGKQNNKTMAKSTRSGASARRQDRDDDDSSRSSQRQGSVSKTTAAATMTASHVFLQRIQKRASPDLQHKNPESSPSKRTKLQVKEDLSPSSTNSSLVESKGVRFDQDLERFILQAAPHSRSISAATEGLVVQSSTTSIPPTTRQIKGYDTQRQTQFAALQWPSGGSGEANRHANRRNSA